MNKEQQEFAQKVRGTVSKACVAAYEAAESALQFGRTPEQIADDDIARFEEAEKRAQERKRGA